ncbi:MAG: VacB/RNase II family 3'-5' exoribonuclease, partial [bacterium]|nr:VacB/RNase II family 3'-5' exoribonuclease [bacterium]
ARQLGSLVDTLGPAGEEWVGVLQSWRGRAVLVPYQSRARFRVAIARKDMKGAREGEVVVVRPLEGRGRRRDGRDRLQGRVVERLGLPGDPEADFRAIAWNHKLPTAFSPQVSGEAEALDELLDPAEKRERLDLREAAFLTIDPPSARDHDDAVWVDQRDGTLRLWVAIADVSHYVEPASALDREALRRGNSVYFPDRAIPMLPARISGDLCSLRAGRDRFAIAVELVIEEDGRATRPRFHAVVIRVRANLAYEDAARGMNGNASSEDGYDEQTLEQLRRLVVIEARLGRRRFERGSIDFDLSESKIVLDESGHPEAIVCSVRTRAHRAIEEAMLAANRAVAIHLLRAQVPAIYRIHEPPDRESLERLREQLARFDLLERGAPPRLDSLRIHRALQRAKGRSVAPLVNMVALRTMTQARYCEENRGHFALGFDAYLHFTSPIRRYADLVVHRALKHAISPDRYPPDPELVGSDSCAAVARFISYRERTAVEAERDMVDLKKCVFMQDAVGEIFDGRITGVAVHGLYVTLDAHDVTGLVPVASLGFGLVLDEAAHALVARRSGARYQLADPMRVEVEDVNLVRGWIRFAPQLADDEAVPGQRKARPRREKGKNGRVKKGRQPGRKARRRGAPNRGRGRR